MHSKGFNAFAEADARILILGSLPGRMSLEKDQYYAQPQNKFWPIMGELIGAFPALPYGARIAILVKNRIALWDVCAEGYRPGSLDSDIVQASIIVNDFSAFFSKHKYIKLIFFNGQKAYQLYSKKVLPFLPATFQLIHSVMLPSTSPANASISFEKKLNSWQAALQNAGII
jgi:TDG/mug DNA glycosylase family protein